ncbi:GlxA family transcriptional regulator [Actinospongicola halichondriae]|uniref:GlxA family transcriptional regulator n=1 Tax=Actinospongicola halichondriae TaxID=3236844 RepID=UPI003D3B42B1
MRPRPILFTAFDGIQSLDVNGPLEVFAAADDTVGGGAYDITVLSLDGNDVRAGSGLRIGVDGTMTDAPAEIDTVVVPGGDGTVQAVGNPAFVAAVDVLAGRSRRVVSVCSGAFVLAAAGLLDGRKATTHWSVADLLADMHPDVDVDPDPIFVRDGNVSTSAGVTTGMDLALALVEEDLGADVALAVAQRLVLFLRRPGSQSQFSAHRAAQIADLERIRELQTWIEDNAASDLSVARLAERVGYSERHLTRLFLDEVGETPARYVQRIRVDVARRRLEESGDGIDAIATAAGFGSTETLRRAFLREVGVAPAQYRARFTALP